MKKNAKIRPDWDTYFMDIAQVVKRRSNCLRRDVAALIVKDRRIISTGYNGTPSGIRNCFAGGCPRCARATFPGENLGECICSHAEENAIIQAACYGVALKNASLYCTDSPCLLCAKMIVSAGIKEVVYEAPYQFNVQAARLFKTAGIRFRQFKRSGKQ
ncbi:MAG: cytidine/deoxycytidylate deaminase family protein [Lentisphaerae bacterium]|nr:cytidine/deoxycytidylate deaminase family protein [Lentisphaerota bacterium]